MKQGPGHRTLVSCHVASFPLLHSASERRRGRKGGREGPSEMYGLGLRRPRITTDQAGSLSIFPEMIEKTSPRQACCWSTPHSVGRVGSGLGLILEGSGACWTTVHSQVSPVHLSRLWFLGLIWGAWASCATHSLARRPPTGAQTASWSGSYCPASWRQALSRWFRCSQIGSASLS